MESVIILPYDLETIPNDLCEYIQNKILKMEKISEEIEKQSGLNWYMDGVPYSDDEEIINIINNILTFIHMEENLKAIKEIKKCESLTMGPRDRITFFDLAGKCFYVIGDLNKSEEYHRA